MQPPYKLDRLSRPCQRQCRCFAVTVYRRAVNQFNMRMSGAVQAQSVVDKAGTSPVVSPRCAATSPRFLHQAQQMAHMKDALSRLLENLRCAAFCHALRLKVPSEATAEFQQQPGMQEPAQACNIMSCCNTLRMREGAGHNAGQAC